VSITPLPAGPAALPVAPAGNLSGGAGDGSFAGLVAALLGPASAGVAVPATPAPAVAAGGEPVDAPGATNGDGESTVDPADDPADGEGAAQVLPLVRTLPLDVLAPLVQLAGIAGPVLPGEPGPEPTAIRVGAPPGGGGPRDATAVLPLPAPAAPTGAVAASASTDAGILPVGDARTSGTDGGGPAPAAHSVAPVAAPPAAPLATPAGPAGGARPAPVVAQVVPEVTRLVSRGEGVHRLTMRLQPEGLGDVRVTLTVRDGQVDVRLSAGDDARRALLEGAPELRRVLEMTGATAARVLVRDLAGSVAPGGQQGWSAQPDDPAGQQGHSTTGSYGGGDASARGRAGTQDQHAGTRGGAAARDGHTDGATALRPDPAGRAPRGVDLTM
jgi:flagellar hook-length control protein FliK